MMLLESLRRSGWERPPRPRWRVTSTVKPVTSEISFSACKSTGLLGVLPPLDVTLRQ